MSIIDMVNVRLTVCAKISFAFINTEIVIAIELAFNSLFNFIID